VGLYLTANSNVSIERSKVLTLDADRNSAGSPSIIDMSVSHAICTLQPDVPRLHTLINVGIILDWRSTLLGSVKQAMSSAYYLVSRYTT
jgi:hypothetical protein